MNYNNNLSMRDLKKNLDNVRLDLILDAISGAEINKDPKDEAFKGAVTKVYINSQQLNAEELSLLVDSTPNSEHRNGNVVCTFRLGRQFAQENQAQLGGLLTDKVRKSVEGVYSQRTALAAGKTPLQAAPVSGQSEGIVSRFMSKLTKSRHQESSFGLG